MAVNGKNKGNSFERKISNLFSERFEQLFGMEKAFRRNPDSGSFFGGLNKQRTQTHDTERASFGDIICPSTFKFAIECKHYKTPPSFGSLVDGNIPMWDKWIAQSDTDAASSERLPLLIIKYNNVSEIVLLTVELPNLPSISKYKTRFVYKLSDLLSLPDQHFVHQ